jgi:hypothetical protein
MCWSWRLYIDRNYSGHRCQPWQLLFLEGLLLLCSAVQCKTMACPEASCKGSTKGRPAHLKHSHGHVRDNNARPVRERVVGLCVSTRLSRRMRAQRSLPHARAGGQKHGSVPCTTCDAGPDLADTPCGPGKPTVMRSTAGRPASRAAHGAASPSTAAPLVKARAVYGATCATACIATEMCRTQPGGCRGAHPEGGSPPWAQACTTTRRLSNLYSSHRQVQQSQAGAAVTGGCSGTGRWQCRVSAGAEGPRTDELGEQDAHHGHHRHTSAGARPCSGSAKAGRQNIWS